MCYEKKRKEKNPRLQFLCFRKIIIRFMFYNKQQKDETAFIKKSMGPSKNHVMIQTAP